MKKMSPLTEDIVAGILAVIFILTLIFTLSGLQKEPQWKDNQNIRHSDR